jgi:hypothetical protein
MPTLIRLVIFLLVLAGLGYGAMFALTVMVDPGEKDITIRIPARELTQGGDPAVIDLDNLPEPVNIAPRSSEPPPADDPSGEPVQTISVPE